MNRIEKTSIAVIIVGAGFVITLMILIALNKSKLKYVTSDTYQEQIMDKMYKRYIELDDNGNVTRTDFNKIINKYKSK